MPEIPATAMLPEWASLPMRAFQALLHDRAYGPEGSPLPIPYSAVSRWAADNGIAGELLALLVRFVQILDDEWRKVSAEKRKAAAGT